MPPSAPHNQLAYDRWSRTYDTYPNPTVALDELTFPALWQGLRGQRVLEIGCGTGRHTVKLAAQGNRVTGVDLSPGMLAVARKRLARASLEAELVQGDVLGDLPLAEGAFDAAVCALVVEHVAPLDRFFARVARLLAPGGRLWLSEIHPERSAQGILAHFVDASGEEVHLEGTAHTEAALRGAAEGAGFAVVACVTHRGDRRLAALNPKWERHLGRPMLQAWELERGA